MALLMILLRATLRAVSYRYDRMPRYADRNASRINQEPPGPPLPFPLTARKREKEIDR